MVLLPYEGPLYFLLALMLATRTFRPTVVALLASATAPAAVIASARADLNAFPGAFPPSAIADFATALASALTLGLLGLIASPLVSLVDPAALR